MTIVYQCVCGREITTREDRAGRIEKCPSCRMSVLVPDGPPAPAPGGRSAPPRGR